MSDAHTLGSLIEQWDGECAVVHHDRETDSWLFVAIHDTVMGIPSGGTRMRVYPTPADGLLDAMRLARGMTHKWAAIELGHGGGKAVLAVPHPLVGVEREGLLTRYGQLLESLNGCFGTGIDLGTTTADMAVVARQTRFVHGFDPDGKALDPGPFTARGVRHGLQAAVAQRFGSSHLAGRTILVQGIGGVGGPLARELAAEGATLLLSDADAARAEALAGQISARVVPVEDALATECDVLAPCAIGGVLNRQTIAQLACAVVAGSANNQLEGADDADRLHQRGILYVPDYVINGGGAVSMALHDSGVTDEAKIFRRVEDLGRIVSQILDEAARRGESPLAAAERRVERTLQEARRRRACRTPLSSGSPSEPGGPGAPTA